MEVDGISWGVNDGASLVSWTFDGNLVVQQQSWGCNIVQWAHNGIDVLLNGGLMVYIMGKYGEVGCKMGTVLGTRYIKYMMLQL